jgi:hypothetical protein
MSTTKKAATKRKATKTKQLTPEQISWNMPIGAAMEAYFNTASEKDFMQKNRIYEALINAVDGLRDKGINGKQVTMAALDFARVMVQAQAEYVQTAGKVVQFPACKDPDLII